MYSDIRARFPSWSVDYPKADRQFLIGLRQLTNIDASGAEHPMRLDDPALREFPVLYAVEVGYMSLTEAERSGLRDYLLAGGFLVVDDFWGTWEWLNFERQIRAVLPEYPIVDIPLDHPLLHVFYDIDEIVQVPNVGQGRSGGPTWGLASGSGLAGPESIAVLERDIVQGLKEFEYSLRRSLTPSDDGRLLQVGDDEVPDGYEEMVEEYYKALAGDRSDR